MPPISRTTTINISGAPGVGKSLIAAALYVALAPEEVYGSVSLVGEYAKELALRAQKGDKEAEKLIMDQPHVTGEQLKLIDNRMGMYDIIIVDSPVILGDSYLEYNYFKGNISHRQYSEWKRKISEMVGQVRNNTLNFMLTKGFRKFEETGRIHDERESTIIHNLIINSYMEYGLRYINIENRDVDETVNIIRAIVDDKCFKYPLG